VIEARPEVELQKYSRKLGSYHEKKSRDGPQVRHHQFQRRHERKMLQKGEYFTSRQEGLEHQKLRWTRRRHASHFNAGSVTFVDGTGNRSMDI
jgi:hypothetical protein